MQIYYRPVVLVIHNPKDCPVQGYAVLLNGSWIGLGDGAAHPVCPILWGVSASIEKTLE